LVCVREHGSGPYDPVKVDISANRANREEYPSSQSVTQSVSQSVISVNVC